MRHRLLLPLAALALHACELAPCVLTTELTELAGEGATDCGTVTVGADSAAVDACVVAAFEAHEAFFAVYELQGIDSQVSTALASDGDTVWSLFRDSDPSGGSQTGAEITRSDCASPTVEPGPDGHDVLTCDQTGCVCSTRACGPENLDLGDCCG
jgi:hypothetical protein